MVSEKEIKTCTSKTFKKGEKATECGQPLLLIMDKRNKKVLALICPDCDGLEAMPRELRERIVEQ